MNTLRTLTARLLRRNISAGQIAGYTLANLVGLAIVMTAVKFYTDVRSSTSDTDSILGADYITVSAPVSGLGSLFSGPESFSAEQIAEIERQPWARKVGSFTSAGFDVTGRLTLGGSGMSTALFLEAVPDEFFDRLPDGWHFDPAEANPVVPIILSSDYLTLYNFGFASSRGLPQISEEMLRLVPIELSVSGNGRQRTFRARIVGLSPRLNTIAAPQDFIDWANATFASAPAAPSRLIIRTDGPAGADATEFLSSRGYGIGGDKAASGRMGQLLRVITGVVIAVGLVIIILAFFIITLSISLLLQKNRPIISRLLMLGFTPGEVGRIYYRLVLWINAGVLVGASMLMLAASAAWSSALEAASIAGSSPFVALLSGIVLSAILTACNLLTVRRHLLACWN